MINLSSFLWMLIFPAAVFQGQVDFEKTLSGAIVRAKSEQRQLVLYFTSSNCNDCKSLDAYLEQETVRQAIDAKYVSAKVDIDAFDGQACGQIYGISKTPALVVVKPDGTITARKEGNLRTEDIESLILHGTFPSPGKGDSSSPDTAFEPTAEETYALQVGFFSDQENAESLKNQIESRGFREARVTPEKRDDKTYYRVLVGDYASAQYAKSDMKTLETSGFSVKVHKYRP